MNTNNNNANNRSKSPFTRGVSQNQNVNNNVNNFEDRQNAPDWTNILSYKPAQIVCLRTTFNPRKNNGLNIKLLNADIFASDNNLNSRINDYRSYIKSLKENLSNNEIKNAKSRKGFATLVFKETNQSADLSKGEIIKKIKQNIGGIVERSQSLSTLLSKYSTFLNKLRSLSPVTRPNMGSGINSNSPNTTNNSSNRSSSPNEKLRTSVNSGDFSLFNNPDLTGFPPKAFSENNVKNTNNMFVVNDKNNNNNNMYGYKNNYK